MFCNHIPIYFYMSQNQKISNMHVPQTKFFWGTHPKTEIGASIKTTLFYVPTSCQIIKGILIFFISPFDL
jgi:hypothetical protein